MMKRRCLDTLSLIIVLSNFAFAVTLSQYREGVVTARAYIEDLQGYADPAADDYDADSVLRIVKAAKAELPTSVKVDQPDGAVEASNAWLHANLDAFLEETDAAKRSALLVDSAERLDALAHKMDELVAATAIEHSKDQDKQKLAEILRREEFQKPKAADESMIQRLLRQLLEWIASMFSQSPPKQPNLSGMPNLAYFLQAILYAIIAILIGLGVYKLAPVIFPKLKRKRPAKRKDRVILGEHIADDVSSGDLFAEAENLAASGDLRGAIRKGYIALICDLSDKRLIGLARYKTNRDYLRELRKRRELLSQMTGVTSAFERNWYGAKTSSGDDWQQFRESCERTIQIARAEA